MTSTTESGAALSAWVQATARSVQAFEASLADLSRKASLPSDVDAASKALQATNVLVTVTAFVEANEKLSGHSRSLRTVAGLPDSAIADAAALELAAVGTDLEAARTTGEAAARDVGALESALDAMTAALNGWKNRLASDVDADKSKIADLQRLLDEANKEKDKMKNDWWYCLLGAIACAAVAAELAIRTSNLNDEISKYRDSLSSEESELANLLDVLNSTTSLSRQSLVLGKSVDEGLKAVQVMQASVNGITATVHSTTPFILRGQLNGLATQLEGMSTASLQASSAMLRAARAQGSMAVRAAPMVLAAVSGAGEEPAPEPAPEPVSPVVEAMRAVTSAAMVVQLSALTLLKQPQLVAAENLLRQDQSLLVGHCADWMTSVGPSVVSALAAVSATSDNVGFVGEAVLERLGAGAVDDAVAGVDSLIDGFDALTTGRLQAAVVSMRLFNEKMKDDASRFATVGDILRNQIGGSAGQVAALEAQDAALQTAIQQSLTDLVSNSTRMLTQTLAWGVVLGVSIGLGQVQFAAVSAPTMMFLVKKGANAAIKGVSSIASAAAKAELKKINDKGGDVQTQIDDRQETLVKLSALKADMAVLHTLVGDSATMTAQSAVTCDALSALGLAVASTGRGAFTTIKFDLKAEATRARGEANLRAALAAWSAAGTAAALLEKSFMNTTVTTVE